MDSYLPCTNIKESYLNTEEFFKWLNQSLLLLFPPGSPHYICLDNISIHINNQIAEAIEAAGYLVRYLPLYLPDFNPIELTFSVLKAWIKRYYWSLRPQYKDFGYFLQTAIAYSGYNCFARAHF